MRAKLERPKGRLREKVIIELEESECNALINGIEVKELHGDTWVVVRPSKLFLEKAKTRGTSRKSTPRKR